MSLYDKINEKICGFDRDRYVHFIILLLISFISAKLLSYCTSYSLLISLGITIIISVGKEIWDSQRGDIFDTHDLLADALGMITGCLMYLI